MRAGSEQEQHRGVWGREEKVAARRTRRYRCFVCVGQKQKEKKKKKKEPNIERFHLLEKGVGWPDPKERGNETGTVLGVGGYTFLKPRHLAPSCQASVLLSLTRAPCDGGGTRSCS
eukprot:Hpha_TRINITY_DN16726_c0_g4::TRINITY_DN16726_c0_g4_i1::g.80492::m.80492